MLLLKLFYFVVLIQAATQCACLAMLIPTHGRRSDPKSCFHSFSKVEKVQEDSLDLIPSPSPSVKTQIIGGKVYLR